MFYTDRMPADLPATSDDLSSEVVSREERALAHELLEQERIDRDAWPLVPAELVGGFVDSPGCSPLIDADLLDMRPGSPSPSDLLLLDSIDPMSLGSPRRVLQWLQLVERLDGVVEALKTRGRVALAGAQASDRLMAEQHVEHELAVAMRSSAYVAGMSIERARVLTSTFPTFLEALRTGQVSVANCRKLVEGTRAVSDPAALAAIGRVLLPKARRMAPGPFEREVARAVADFDPDAAARHRRSREQRAVWTRPLPDGMSFLGMIHDTPTITAIKSTLDTDADALRAVRRARLEEPTAEQAAGDAARRALVNEHVAARKAAEAAAAAAAAAAAKDGTTAETAADGTACVEEPVETDPVSATPTVELLDDADAELIGACRADALAARILGTMDETGAIDWTPKAGDVQVQLVIDLDTLRAEADRACLIDGQPVPAQIGRELAGYAQAFRRIVTDPLTGHLLDYGRTRYLPAPLRSFTLARDGGCRAPGCTTTSPRRLQMDHGVPFPEGPSDPGNTGGLCLAHHQLKTSGFLQIENGRPDGSCDWVTAWGQRVHIPARPFLHDPGDHRPDPPEPPDPPPF
jgi:hypothetical protein